MMRLCEFQNGKMGLCGPKIVRYRVNSKILRNNSFRKEKHNFLTKIEIEIKHM